VTDENLQHLIDLVRPQSALLPTVRHYIEIHETMRQVVNQYAGYHLKPGARIDFSVLGPIIRDPSVPGRVRDFFSQFYGAGKSFQMMLSRANTLAAPVSIDGIRAPNAASLELIDHFIEVTGSRPQVNLFVTWINSHRS
jgi:hypothetical protein